jgi:uncharacterized damage-inducible protein DinB
MPLSKDLAKHFREVYFSGNWTASNLKSQLETVSWDQANTSLYGSNTIVALVYHIHYYVRAMLGVLEGGPLDARDRYSFDHPKVESQEDWDQLLKTTWAEAETFASRIEELTDHKLSETFVDEKYGNYQRNIMGVIEHTHYHLGQIALIKKIIQGKQGNKSDPISAVCPQLLKHTS